MVSARKYLGGDNTLRSKAEHLLYLERCAKDWESQFVPGWYGREAREKLQKSHQDQADRIRAKIKAIRDESEE